MKLGLIALSGLRVQKPELQEMGLTLPGFIERREVIASLPSLGLLTLAGMTPPEFDVDYIELQDFDEHSELPEQFDAVAISSFTAQINAAYALADKYREAGVKVIMGGLHVTALAQEAALHADSILVGEAELAWPQLLDDLLNDNLQAVYDVSDKSFNLSQSPMPRFDLLEVDKYNRLTVQTQRGCPLKCEFCASSIRLSPRFKTKPIDKVIAEIRAIKAIWPRPFIELADDNTFANKKHAKHLVRALAQENIKWFTETDISVAEDDELLALLSQSGCRQLLIGFESPNAKALSSIELKTDWKRKQLDRYKGAIEKIQRYGISVNGCFILGMDGTNTNSFDEIFDFVVETGLSEVQITIQTPFPGTELYDRLHAEDRLLKQTFWDECTLFDVTYTPDLMSVEELESGFRQLMKKLYNDDLVKQRKAHFAKLARTAKQKQIP